MIMKSNYLKRYYLSCVIVIGLFILLNTFPTVITFGFWSADNVTTIIILIINFIILGLNLLSEALKYKMNVDNNKTPLAFLIIMLLIVLLAIIMNHFVLVESLHYSYYYNFILLLFLALNIYTFCCYEGKDKKKNK